MPTFQAEVDGQTIEFEADSQPTEQELSEALHQHLTAQAPSAPPAAPEIGAGKTFLQHAASGVGPGLAFIAGAAPGAEFGAAAGSALGPLGTAVGGAVGGLVTGVPAAWAASKVQHAALKAVAPEFTQKLDTDLAQGEEQHPLAAIAGDVASFAPSAKLAPFKLAQLPFRAALGAGVGAGLPLVEGRSPTWKDVATGAASGTLFGEARFKLLPQATAAAGRAAQATLAKLKGVKTTPEAAAPATSQAAGSIQGTLENATAFLNEARASGDPAAIKQAEDLMAAAIKASQSEADRLRQPKAGTEQDAAERAAIDAGENEGSTVKIVDSFSGEDPNAPFARQFMRPTAAGIEVKRSEFAKWLETVPPEQQQAAIEQRIAEEHIHRHVSAEDAADYWDSLSHVEKLAETRAYTGEWSQAAYQRRFGGKGFTDTQMGHEALRRRMQRLASGTSSEIAEAATTERWKLEGLDALSRTIRTLRETLGTDASQNGLAILDRVQSNLDAAKTAIGKPTDPDWQVTVQSPQPMPDGQTVVPGYVQIDDVSGGQNKWSKNPQTLREEGFNVPSGIEQLPSGKYSMADAQRLLKQQEQPAALRKEPTDEWKGWVKQLDELTPLERERATYNLADATPEELERWKAKLLQIQFMRKMDKPAALRKEGAEEKPTHWGVSLDGEPYGVFARESVARMVASGLSGKVEIKPVNANQFIEPNLPGNVLPMEDAPGALRKGGREEPEFPGMAKATMGKGVLSKPPTAKAGPGIDLPETVVSPAAVSAAAKQHFTERARPSFPDFVAEVRTRLGPVQPGQLREVFQDAMWQHLQEMPGAELGKLQAKFGTQKEAAVIKGKSYGGQIADAPAPAPSKGFLLTPEVSPSQTAPLDRYLDKEGKLRVIQAQRTRNTVIANIAERLMAEAQEGRKAWHRKEITPEDIRYGAFEDQRQPSWQELSRRDVADPQTLTGQLTADARSSKDDPLSATKRVTIAVGIGGDVHAVSTYLQPARGGQPAQAMLFDPISRKLRVSVPLDSFLRRYRPIASVLLDEPVQNFHQKWASVAEFENAFGQEARERAANAQYDPAGYTASEGEFEPSERGAKLARPGVYQDQPGAWDKTGTITDAEAGAIIDHVMEESGSFEGPEDVQASLAALSEKTNRQALSGYRKLFAEFEKKNPKLTDQELLDYLAKQLYENHKASQSYEDFIARAMDQGGAQNRPLAPAEAPSGPTGQELTMPIDRVPPTTLRPEMLPPGYQGPARRPAPAVPEGSLVRSSSEAPAALRKSLQPAADELQSIGHSIKALVSKKTAPTIDEILKTNAAASNEPHLKARKAEIGVRLQSAKPTTLLNQEVKGDPRILSAATAVVQSSFSRSRLPIFQNFVRNGLIKAERMANSANWQDRRLGRAWVRYQGQLKAELDYAAANWGNPELQATARRMKDTLDQQLLTEGAKGIDIATKPDYLPQRYTTELWNGDSVLIRGLTGNTAGILGKKWKQAAVFKNYYEASNAGPYIAATRDGASLVGHRVRQGWSSILRKEWQTGLQGITTPDGKPLAVEPKLMTDKSWASPTQGYEIVPQQGRKPLAVHEDYVKLVKNLTSDMTLRDTPVLGEALHLAQMIKHSLLVGDFFHMGRMLYYASAIMGKNAGWKGGWSVLDISPGDVDLAVRRGVLRPEDAAWGRTTVDFNGTPITRQQLAHKFVKSGAELGRIQDALYKDLVTSLTPTAGVLRRTAVKALDPTAGRYNRFLFDQLTRGLMLESNVREFERQSKANPTLNHDALVRDIAKDVNTFFGNIGKQGWFKAGWHHELASLFALAPGWVEGLVKKEANFMERATGIASLRGKREGLTTLGTVGTGIGKGLIFMAGLTQAINLITRHKPTWQNEEKGHKFDAWIPGKGTSEGFWLSPMALFNEMAHDVYRLSESKPKGIEVFQQIAGNKESPLTRAALLALVGKSPTGEYQTTTAGTLGEAAKQLAPVPITFGKYAQALGHAIAPKTIPATPPGAMQRQAMATIGLKVEPKMSAAGEVGRLAKDFMKREGMEKETGWMQVQTDEPGYTKMRQALRSGDQAAAQKNLEALRRQHTDQQIVQAMKQWAQRGFTGAKQTENQFMASLDDRQMAAYGQAIDGKYRDLEAFYDLITK